jgi:hypothetical protein
MALVVAVNAGAQGTTIYEYPWNPDSNNDNLIGVDDLLDFLPVFGYEFGNPPEPCDYDGTPLEDLIAGITNGDIILDSIFIEYQLEDVSTYYLVGCPDPVTDTLFFSNSVLLTNYSNYGNFWQLLGIDAFNGLFILEFLQDLQNGLYAFKIQSFSLSQMGSEGFFGGDLSSTTDNSPIPFPEGWYLDEDGIHLESGWDENDWAYYANYLHILPYWHYAE